MNAGRHTSLLLHGCHAGALAGFLRVSLGHQLAALAGEGVLVSQLQLAEGVVDVRVAGLIRAHRQDHLRRVQRRRGSR